MNLNDIKGIHKVFNVFNSCDEFYEFIKTLENAKKLNILKKDKNFSINFQVEFLFKQEEIEILLYPSKISLDIIVKDVCKELELLRAKLKNYEENYVKKDFSFEEKIKEIIDKQYKENLESINNKMNLIEEENKNLKNEIKMLQDEINEIKSKKEENAFLKEEIVKIRKEIKDLKNGKKINSSIIKEDEFDFIELALKNRIDKPILSIEKYIKQQLMEATQLISIQDVIESIIL